jgi:trehalose 6-phosphate phosphatase
VTRYDDPAEIAHRVASCPRPLLVGLDVDGVLAPIVDHADDAALLAGMGAAVSAVAALDDVFVAVVSGRSLAGLAQFGFGDDVEMIGSHGMETRDHPMEPLTDDERTLLAGLHGAAVTAAERAGAGAWVERKPASVVLHVRQADDSAGAIALLELADVARRFDGATVKAGSGVLEAFARHTDKGTALMSLASDLGVATTVFLGDDLTDEEAFTRLSPGDVAVKVGDADTVAPHRLADPSAVLTFLQALLTTTFA